MYMNECGKIKIQTLSRARMRISNFNIDQNQRQGYNFSINIKRGVEETKFTSPPIPYLKVC